MSFQPAPPVRPWRALSDGCRVVELDLDLDLDPPAFAGLLQVKEPGRPRREEERPQGKAGKGVSSLPPFMGSAETHLY